MGDTESLSVRLPLDVLRGVEECAQDLQQDMGLRFNRTAAMIVLLKLGMAERARAKEAARREARVMGHIRGDERSLRRAGDALLNAPIIPAPRQRRPVKRKAGGR